MRKTRPFCAGLGLVAKLKFYPFRSVSSAVVGPDFSIPTPLGIPSHPTLSQIGVGFRNGSGLTLQATRSAMADLAIPALPSLGIPLHPRSSPIGVHLSALTPLLKAKNAAGSLLPVASYANVITTISGLVPSRTGGPHVPTP